MAFNNLIDLERLGQFLGKLIVLLNGKVDKETGKGLSSNDYTSTEKTKLSGIESGAQVNTITGVKGDSESSYRTGNVNLTKANLGLGNVENKSSATIRGELTSSNVTTALGYTPPQSDTTYSAMTENEAKTGTDTTAKLISAEVLDAAIENKGYTGNTGTITEITMNGTSKGTSGNVDLGTVITAHQDISGKADKTSTVSSVAYDSTNKKITETINGTTSDVVTVSTLKTALNLAKGDVGLGNVDNTSDANKPVSTAQQTALDGKLNASLKGAANGLAELDANGKVPASQLPSYVDDVIECNGQSAFPSTGETGKVYVDTSNNKTYRWSGTAYVVIASDLALGETSSTAYRGDYGAAAYAHGVTNKGSAFSSGLYKITTNSEGHVTAATAVQKSDITGLGIPGSDTTYSEATTSAAGLMSSTDKSKLDGIASGAQVNSITGVKGDSENEYRTGNVNISKANIGLGNVENSALSTWAGTSNLTTCSQGTFGDVVTHDASEFAAASHGTHVTAATVKAALGTGSGTSKFLREDGSWVTPTDSTKLNANLGSANAGKFLVVGSDGSIVAVTMAEWQGGNY